MYDKTKIFPIEATFFVVSISRIFDLVTTALCIRKGGIEINPVTNLFISAFGFNGLWILYPIQIFIVAITSYVMYYIISKTDYNSPKIYPLFNTYITLFILLNFSPTVNNLLVYWRMI